MYVCKYVCVYIYICVYHAYVYTVGMTNEGLQGGCYYETIPSPCYDDEVLRPIRHDLRGGLARQNNDLPAAAAA